MLQTGSPLHLRQNTTIRSPRNIMSRRSVILSCPSQPLSSFRTIGRLVRTTKRRSTENGARWTHTINLGVAKRLSNIPVVLSATLEKQLDGGNQKFQANLTMTYYFERFHLPK